MKNFTDLTGRKAIVTGGTRGLGYGYRDEHGTDRSIESTICRNYRTYSCSRLGTPEDMKGPCVFLASDASDYLNGAIIPVDGGYLVK